MDAVGVAEGVGQLLGGEPAPLLLVDGGVGVPPVGRQLCDVEHSDGDLRLREDFPDDLHYGFPAVRAPVIPVCDHGGLVVAIPAGLAAPVYAPAAIKLLFVQAFDRSRQFTLSDRII